MCQCDLTIKTFCVRALLLGILKFGFRRCCIKWSVETTMLLRKLRIKQYVESSGCVVRCGSKNGHQEDMCLIEIGLHTQKLLIWVSVR